MNKKSSGYKNEEILKEIMVTENKPKINEELVKKCGKIKSVKRFLFKIFEE